MIELSEGTLYVSGEKDLAGLARFPDADTVQILGCDLESLEGVAKLPGLQRLQVLCTPVRDLSALRASTKLVELEVNLTFVRDLAPLHDLPGLHLLRLYGNPLSDASRHEVLPRLGEKALVEASPVDEWGMTRQIFDAGVGRTYGYVPRSHGPALVRPGCGTEGRVVDFYEYPLDAMKEALANPKFADYGMFHKSGITDPEKLARPRERFCASWLAGNAEDARAWIDSAGLPSEEREQCRAFVARFSDQIFYLDLPSYVDEMERARGVRLPAWFRRARGMLAGVRPLAKVEYDVERFPRKAITRAGGRYKLGYLGYYNDDDRALFGTRCGMYPIGDIATPRDYGCSMLAINLRDPDDGRIYEFWPSAVYDAPGERSLFTPVCRSWGELLASVTGL